MKRVRIDLPDTGISSKDDRMSIDVFRPDYPDAEKIAFVLHGRNGSSDSPHLLKMIEPYLKRHYTVVSPNLCNSNWNDSAGTGSDFLIADHIRDSKRAIEWAKASRRLLGWQGTHIALCGHSMGGYAACYLAATDYNDITRHVLTVAPFTDGNRMIKARANTAFHPQGIDALKADCPNALEDWPEHSIYKIAKDLRMPVSAIVGASDTLTLPDDIIDFFVMLPNGVEILILKNEHHCLTGNNVSSILGSFVTALEDFSIRGTSPLLAPSIRGPF